MKKHLLSSLLTSLCIAVLAPHAHAVLPSFFENFESQTANSTFVNTSFLDGHGGKVLQEGNGNKYFSVDAQDHKIFTLQAPGTNDFVLTFRQSQSSSSDWNRVFALYWDNFAGHVQLIRTPTGIGFGDIAYVTGSHALAVSGSTASTDWLWFRLTRIGTSLKIDGSLTNNFTGAPTETITLNNCTSVNLLDWEFLPTLNVDDISLAPVPEPASLGLLGLSSLLVLRRRR